jgi:uncharacterized membrane protein YvbJ
MSNKTIVTTIIIIILLIIIIVTTLFQKVFNNVQEGFQEGPIVATRNGKKIKRHVGKKHRHSKYCKHNKH